MSGDAPGVDGAGVRRVVLLGFMAAGKSTVGRRLAAELDWRFVDVDAEVERREGRPVADLFETPGEARFRELEAEVAAEAMEGADVVIAPGGGWVMAPGALDALPPATLTIWLRVSAREAVRRAGAASAADGAAERPLLAVPDPLSEAERLLRERESLYRRAALWIDTEDSSIEEIVGQLVTRVAGTPGTGADRSHTGFRKGAGR